MLMGNTREESMTEEQKHMSGLMTMRGLEGNLGHGKLGAMRLDIGEPYRPHPGTGSGSFLGGGFC